METFFSLLAICEGNSPVTGEFPAQRPVTRNFDIFSDLRLNKTEISNREAGDLRRHRALYDVTVMYQFLPTNRCLLSSLISISTLSHLPYRVTSWTPLCLPYCRACRTSLIATRFWVVVICPIIKCLTVLEFSFLLFDLCLFITIFNFILNYVPIVTFWIFTYHKIWILLIIFCFIWSYWIIYFLTCLEVFWSAVS